MGLTLNGRKLYGGIQTGLMYLTGPRRKAGGSELPPGKLWTSIYMEREGKIRIISVRRSRENERNAYYER